MVRPKLSAGDFELECVWLTCSNFWSQVDQRKMFQNANTLGIEDEILWLIIFEHLLMHHTTYFPFSIHITGTFPVLYSLSSLILHTCLPLCYSRNPLWVYMKTDVWYGWDFTTQSEPKKALIPQNWEKFCINKNLANNLPIFENVSSEKSLHFDRFNGQLLIFKNVLILLHVYNLAHVLLRTL